jgi:hypothetical protein
MNKPFRWELNVSTAERKQIELTDAEIADAQMRKLIEDAEQAMQFAVDARKTKRTALLEKLLDEMEAKEI